MNPRPSNTAKPIFESADEGQAANLVKEEKTPTEYSQYDMQRYLARCCPAIKESADKLLLDEDIPLNIKNKFAELLGIYHELVTAVENEEIIKSQRIKTKFETMSTEYCELVNSEYPVTSREKTRVGFMLACAALGALLGGLIGLGIDILAHGGTLGAGSVAGVLKGHALGTAIGIALGWCSAGMVAIPRSITLFPDPTVDPRRKAADNAGKVLIEARQRIRI